MTWPDVIRSVTTRIPPGRAQDRELQALYLEATMGRVPAPTDTVVTIYCAACGWHSVAFSEDAPECCLHCGAANPEVVEIIGRPEQLARRAE